MAKAEFKVGDRVLVLRDHDGASIKNREATVKGLTDWGTARCEFDEKVGPRMGHSCDGTCKNGYGWVIPIDYLKLTPLTPFDHMVHDYIRRELS